MTSRALVFSAALLITLGSSAALADTFNFSFGTSTDTFSGSGQLTGDMTSPGVYTINIVTGTTTINGVSSPISGIEDPGTFEGNDNLVNDVGGVYNFDQFGLSYILDSGAQINIFLGTDGDSEIFEDADGTFGQESVPYSITPASVAPIPEPDSLLLLGTGLLSGLGAFRRRIFA